MTRIALLGCGTVGTRIAEVLLTERESLAQRTGIDLALSRILVRDGARDRGHGIDRTLLTTRFEDILADPDLELVIEVVGGLEPARQHVARLLERGVHVVTANKSVVAHHGNELRAAAQRSGAVLACEASVCAAVPVLAALRSLSSDRIRAIRGIINGTCNFILSTMSSESCSIAEALSTARQLGFAEPDPSADLSGQDAAEKLCVLADGIGIDVSPTQVGRSGIESIEPNDLRQARQWGFEIKCLAELEGGEARVGPVLLPRGHQLCQVRGADNALVIDTERSGEIVLRGRGAGLDPTAAAIIGDVTSILRNGRCESISPPLKRCTGKAPALDRGGFFVRIAKGQAIQPASVINAFRQYGVEIALIECRTDACAILTRLSDRDSISSAVDRLCQDGHRSVFVAPVRFVEAAEDVESQAIELKVETKEEFEYGSTSAEAA